MDAEAWELSDGTVLEYDEFASYLESAIEQIPDQFASAVENVAFLALAEPDAHDFQRLKLSHPGREFGNGEILGLYTGVPITKRSFDFSGEPCIIKLFAGPISRYCGNKERVERQVYRTLVHEVGHYFGLNDEELRRMGY